MHSKDADILSIDTNPNLADVPIEHINLINSNSNMNPERLKKKDLIILLKLARMKIN